MAFDFNGGYDRNNFINFLRTDLFRNKFTLQQIPVKPERKTAFFVENGIYQLGTIELGDEEISVFEIKQSSKNDPRVTLTQDTFKLMGDLGIDNAIVALYVDNKSSWRFSLLTTKYEDFKKSTSNPKRFSFILGPNEKVRTVNQQLIKKGEIKDFKDLVSRFDVEVVRKEFFETYLELFVRLYKDILKDKPFVELLTSQNVDLVSFTKNLLGKIIFLYFIQQKGWLGLGKNTTTKYGDGDKDFMRKLWNNFKNQKESLCIKEKTGYFYNDYLEWLFYAGLNADRRDKDDRFEQLQMKVPYLNGGLFKEEYEGRKNNISKISNDIFSNVDKKGDSADGILDIFDRYNFTVDEDSLYDTDIAVDPEMLGRIFEKMISISSDNIKDVLQIYDKKKTNSKFDFGKDLNKKLGAFYTPREIVHYMTKESLITYLQNKTNVSEENIKILFDLKEKFLLNSTDMKKAEYSTEQLMEIGNSIIEIDEALRNVKILDPAVGSGAFPMGLLHEISNLRYYMYKVFDKILKERVDSYMQDGNISLYKIKKDIILNNIYGIDIDPGAIDIAKLRFRLSLVVDEQEPEPLPNFEFKFVCANSLIPLDNSIQEKDLFSTYDEPKLETLKSYKRDFYNADSNDLKKQLKERIKSYTKTEGTLFSEPTKRAKQMEEFGENFDNPKHSNSFFDPGLMLSESKGFDIVIGNPPYINIYDIDENLKPVYQSLFKTAYQKYDMYVLFYEKGLSLLKKGGHLNYITSNKFLSQGYGYELRKLFLENSIKIMINFNYDIFDNATVRTLILLCEKKASKDNTINIIDINTKDESHKFKDLIYSQIKQSIFENTDQNNFRLNLTTRKIELLNKIKNDSTLLEDICSVNYGLRPSSEKLKLKKDAFIYDYDKGGLKQYFEGKDMGYWLVKKISFLDYKPNVMYNPMFPELFEYEKLVGLRTLSDIYKLRFIYDNEGLYCNDSTVVLTLRHLFEKVKYQTVKSRISKERIDNSKKYNYQYLQAILNSKLIKFYVNELLYDGTHFYPDHMKQLPIRHTEDQNGFINIVNKIYDICKTSGYNFEEPTEEQINLEKQLDQMIYRLYGLTDEEIKIIEDSFK